MPGPGEQRSLSVVMPLFEAGGWVAEAIGSVLERADRLLELIVVDDGSTDGGGEISAGFGDRVRVLRQDNAGPAAARNAGISVARGDLVGFLDADDVWVAGAPDLRLAALTDPAVAVAIAKVQPTSPTLNPWGEPRHGVLAGAAIVRREVFAEHGLLDEDRLHGEDVDWLQRMREAGVPIAYVDQVASLYRQRSGSLAHDRDANRRALAELIRDSLDRRGLR